MIKSLNEVDVHEADGKDDKIWPRKKLRVSSHPLWSHFVILQWYDEPEREGGTVAVNAADLEAAIKNAQNSNRHG